MSNIPAVYIIKLFVVFVAANNLAYCKDNACSPAQDDKITIFHLFAESP